MSERRGSVSTWNHSGLKNAETQSSSAAAITASQTYDAFGNSTASSGTWTSPFGYAGDFGYQEDASGLKLLGHRYLDPSTGRFLTRDPAKKGANWYVYCENDPISSVDPDGLDKKKDKLPGGSKLTIIIWPDGTVTEEVDLPGKKLVPNPYKIKPKDGGGISGTIPLGGGFGLSLDWKPGKDITPGGITFGVPIGGSGKGAPISIEIVIIDPETGERIVVAQGYIQPSSQDKPIRWL